MGYKNADDYSKFALEAAKLMKWIDRNIQLIASVSSNFGTDWMEWNRTVLKYLASHIEYISLHTYVGSGGDYYEFMAQPVNVDLRIERTEDLIEETRLRQKIQKPSIFPSMNTMSGTGPTNITKFLRIRRVLVVAVFSIRSFATRILSRWRISPRW
jgi:hypothetical protein